MEHLFHLRRRRKPVKFFTTIFPRRFSTARDRVREDGSFKLIAAGRVREDGSFKLIAAGRVREDGSFKLIAAGRVREDELCSSELFAGGAGRF